MTDESKRLERAKKLMEALQVAQTQVNELIDQVDKVLRGEVAMGDTLKTLERHWDGLWSARYGGHYVWNYTRDRAQWKRLLKNVPPEELLRRSETFLRDGDPFNTRARHAFALFASTVNRYTTELPASELSLDAPPVDCHHQPQCQSDQEHSRRVSAEARDAR